MPGCVGGGNASFLPAKDQFEMDTDNNLLGPLVPFRRSRSGMKKKLYKKDLDSSNTYHTSESHKKQVQILIQD